MAQWIKAFTSKPVDLSSVPKTHISIDGENQLLKAVPVSPHIHGGMCGPCTYHTQIDHCRNGLRCMCKRHWVESMKDLLETFMNYRNGIMGISLHFCYNSESVSLLFKRISATFEHLIFSRMFYFPNSDFLAVCFCGNIFVTFLSCGRGVPWASLGSSVSLSPSSLSPSLQQRCPMPYLHHLEEPLKWLENHRFVAKVTFFLTVENVFWLLKTDK